MMIKYVNNKKGGGKGVVNYLLNERVKDGTARVLKGDKELTNKLISTIENKQKTTFLVLSFEEKNIPDHQKKEIMKDFEKAMFPGMEERINTLWVEHTDKGRLELNLVVPKVDLETGRGFNPYHYNVDKKRKDTFAELTNLKYGFTSTLDPAKRQTLTLDKNIKYNQSARELDKQLHELVANDIITSRAEIIETLQKHNIEVTREGKDYISVKTPGAKRANKLKGGIYEERFTSIDKLESISRAQREREDQYNHRDISREQQQLREQLDSLIEHKSKENREFIKKSRTNKKTLSLTERSDNITIDSSNNLSNDTAQNSDNLANTKAEQSRNQKLEVHQEQKSLARREQKLLHTNRGLKNDRIRERADSTAQITANSIRDRVETDSRYLYAKAEQAMRDKRARSISRKRYRKTLEKLGELFKIAAREIRYIHNVVTNRNEIEKTEKLMQSIKSAREQAKHQKPILEKIKDAQEATIALYDTQKIQKALEMGLKRGFNEKTFTNEVRKSLNAQQVQITDKELIIDKETYRLEDYNINREKIDEELRTNYERPEQQLNM